MTAGSLMLSLRMPGVISNSQKHLIRFLYAVRHVEEPALEAAAVGLIAGGLVALLLWPLFDVA